jgi:serine/threonine protein kinase
VIVAIGLVKWIIDADRWTKQEFLKRGSRRSRKKIGKRPCRVITFSEFAGRDGTQWFEANPDHSIRDVAGIIIQVLGVLGFLEDKGWAHGDVKWDNVVIDENFVVRLIDLESAKKLAPSEFNPDVLGVGRMLEDLCAEFEWNGVLAPPRLRDIVFRSSLDTNGNLPPNGITRISELRRLFQVSCSP